MPLHLRTPPLGLPPPLPLRLSLALRLLLLLLRPPVRLHWQ